MLKTKNLQGISNWDFSTYPPWQGFSLQSPSCGPQIRCPKKMLSGEMSACHLEGRCGETPVRLVSGTGSQSSGVYRLDPVWARVIKLTGELQRMLLYMPSKLLFWSFVNILMEPWLSGNLSIHEPPWTAWMFGVTLWQLPCHELDSAKHRPAKILHEL